MAVDDVVPIEPDNAKCDFAEFRNRMRLSGAYDEIGRHFISQNKVHRLNDVAGKAEIAPHADVAEIEFSIGQNGSAPFIQFTRRGQAKRRRRCGVRASSNSNRATDNSAASTRPLVSGPSATWTGVPFGSRVTRAKPVGPVATSFS